MKIKILPALGLTSALAYSLMVLTAVAQDDNMGPPPGGPGDGPGGSSGEHHHHHRPPPIPIVTALDTNRDGIIDSNEIANASAALKTLDKNGDGQLTVDEYLPPHPADAPADDSHHPPTPLIVKALDVNGDGVIDATEIANASSELLTLDKKGDGRLTRDEYIGKRPGRPPEDADGGNDAGGPPPDNMPAGPPQ